MQAKPYIPRVGAVMAVQIPPRTAALQAMALPGLRAFLRCPEAELDAATGELVLPAAELEEGERAPDEESARPKPGDWLVMIDGELDVYDEEGFKASFMDPLSMDPEVKGVLMPRDISIPPVIYAATDLLVRNEDWPVGAHNALVSILAHYHNTSLPSGFVGLPIDRLWKLDRVDYEKLQALFPNLPDMPAMISLDTSIGARH